MIFILIITALATTAKGVIKCNFTETSGSPPCFGAVGQRLIFHLRYTPNTEMKLVKDNKRILRIHQNQSVTVDEEYADKQWITHHQSEFLLSGELILGMAAMKHSGSYLMEEFYSNGILRKKVTLHLQIQAPVSQPAVSQLCLSPGHTEVSCSSEGAEAELSLSLDDHLLINTSEHNLTRTNCTERKVPLAESGAQQDKSHASHVTVCLNGRLSGKLLCKAWNTVSRHQTVAHLEDCDDFLSSFPVATVAVTVGVILLLLATLCLGIKKIHHKPKPTTVNERNDETEIVYADVTVIRNVKRNLELNQHSVYSECFPGKAATSHIHTT